MASTLFNVVVDGKVLEGFDRDAVLAQLQQQLKLPEQKARQLLAGNRVNVKRNVAEHVADAYCNRLQALGLNAQRLAIPATAATNAPSDDATVSYFEGGAIAPLSLANSGRYRRSLRRATAHLITNALGYIALAMLGLAVSLYYLIHFAYLLTAPPILFSASLYLLPLIALLVFTLFVWRPLLPMKAPPATTMKIERGEQAPLFAFVEQLCAALAVNPPGALALGIQTSIAISPIPGWKNFSRGNYQLAVGLPLLDASSVAQFAGLLAGNLRTRATPAGLRYVGLLMAIQRRLQNCLNGADWLCDRIERLRWHRFPPLTGAIRALFEISDQLLQKSFSRCSAVDRQLQRELLHEHDRYLALIAGSSALPSVLLLQEKLSASAKDAVGKNNEERGDGGLVDNLPALIRHYFASFDEKIERSLRRRWDSETTSRSDAAPIARERIEQVAAENGLLDNASPATALLVNPDAAAQAVTLQYYCGAGYQFDADNLLPVDTLTDSATQDIVQRQQAAVYFNNWFKPFRFWKLAEYQLIREMSLQDAAEQLSVCVNEIRRLSPDRFKLLAEYERLQNQILEILLAQHVLAAGKRFPFRHVRYDGTTLQPLLDDCQQQLAIVMDKLALQETVMGGRITLGLRLSGQSESDIDDLHNALRLLNDSGARLYKLSLDVYQLEQLLQRQYRQREADYSSAIKRLEEKIGDAGNVLLARLNEIPCPLNARHRSLKTYVEAALQQPSKSTDKSPVLQRTRRMLDVLYAANEKLSLLAADYGTIAEEAYRIEPIKLVVTAD